MFSLLGHSAQAIDPFTIAAVVGTGASAISGVVSEMASVADTAHAVTELGDELGGVGEMDEQSRRTIKLIQETQDIASEIGYTAGEIEAITGVRSTQTVASGLRVMTRMVRAGKQVYRLGVKLSQKAELAQVAMSDQAATQTAIQKALLEIEKQKQLEVKKSALERAREIKREQDRYKALVRKTRPGGPPLPAFPELNTNIKAALTIANAALPLLLALLLPLFLVRVLIVQFGIFGNQNFEEIVDDLIWALILFSTVPYLIEYSFEIGRALAKVDPFLAQPYKLIAPERHEGEPLWRMAMSAPYGGVMWFLVKLRSVIMALLQGIVDLSTGFYIAIFPIVVFASRMLKMRAAMPQLLATLVSLALWPAAWELTTLLCAKVWAGLFNEASIEGLVASIVVLLINMAIPSLLQRLLAGSTPLGVLRSAPVVGSFAPAVGG